MNIAKYLKLRYDINSRNGGVNCWTLYVKVMLDELGIDVPVFHGVTNSKDSISDEFNERMKTNQGHIRVVEPNNLDLCIFKYKEASKQRFHCGIWWKGKVLHANGSGNSGGIWYDRIKDIQHDTVEYYRHASI